EKKYPLRKEVLKQMLRLKLESEEESTMALELESEEHKNWLVHKQTACGKDFSNPFMVDNLPKIVGFSTHLASLVKSWLVQDQTVLALASPKANGIWLQRSIQFGTHTKDSPFDLVAYTDRDYAGASLDRKSTTGGYQFLGCRLISWQCMKQTVVANSITEAEYIAASNCCGQVLRIQNQLLDCGYNFMQTKIHIDNKNTICIGKNPIFHSKTKHMEIRHHFIKDSYEKNLFQMIKIHTDQNVADLLTKAFDVKIVNGEVQLQALVDGKKLIITETSVRRDLKLEDAKGIECLPNADIFEQLALTGMVKNVDSSVKFLMYPRFVQVFLDKQVGDMSTHDEIFVTPSHTKKVFSNMKRVGKGFSRAVTPLFPTMMVRAQEEMGEGSAMPTDPHHTPIIQPSTSQPQKKQSMRKQRKDTEIPQSSGPTKPLADEDANEENVPT
ncbi:hypothetical protein Tco_0634776, partial [Tanacetum coccineum]